MNNVNEKIIDAKDFPIGTNQAYDLFKQTDFPTVLIGKNKSISLPAYLLWKMNKKGGMQYATKRN